MTIRLISSLHSISSAKDAKDPPRRDRSSRLARQVPHISIEQLEVDVTLKDLSASKHAAIVPPELWPPNSYRSNALRTRPASVDVLWQTRKHCYGLLSQIRNQCYYSRKFVVRYTRPVRTRASSCTTSRLFSQPQTRLPPFVRSILQ